MQSTKKAPLRKEDGTMAATDDGATIAQSAGPNMTQVVRSTLWRDIYCGSHRRVPLSTWPLSLYMPLTFLCFSNSTLGFPLFLLCLLPPNTSHCDLILFHPNFNCQITASQTLLLLCVHGWLPKGEGDEDPQIKEGNKENKVKCVCWNKWEQWRNRIEEVVFY